MNPEAKWVHVEIFRFRRGQGFLRKGCTVWVGSGNLENTAVSKVVNYCVRKVTKDVNLNVNQ